MQRTREMFVLSDHEPVLHDPIVDSSFLSEARTYLRPTKPTDDSARQSREECDWLIVLEVTIMQ